MLIRDLTIYNFGIYGGTHTFRLNPSLNDDKKSLILFIGKNGVGKTTLVEALKLVLWGSLSVSDKLSLKDYENYLRSKLHRPKKQPKPVEEASISILFDYVRLGEKNQYYVERKWKKGKSGVNESLLIIENEKEFAELDQKEKDLFLRELFPPGFRDLFFFDGEKLNMFNRSKSTSILSGSIRSLLGLDTVEQLQEDILYFLKEESNNYQFDEIISQYEEIKERIRNLLDEQVEIKSKIQKLKEEKNEILKDEIPQKEQEITKHGRWDKSKLESLKNKRGRLEEKIDQLEKQLIELCNGLVPFASIPRFLNLLSKQLEKEKAYKTWTVSNKLVDEQLSLIGSTETINLLKESTKKVSTVDLNRVVKEIKEQIKKTLPPKPLEESELTHRLSDENYEKFLSWIRASKTSVPVNFRKLSQELSKTRNQLSKLEEELSWSANEEFSQPLFEELASYNQRVGEINSKIEELNEREKEIEGKINFHNQRRDNLEEKLNEKNNVSRRLQLAQNSKELLEEYSERLQANKLEELGNLIVNKFNLLCRKESIFDEAVIKPDDFSITLFKGKEVFNKNDLSAGEKQLLSLSILWALYDISQLPAPIIVDTPLSRLDTEHRKNLTEHFFAEATHQMLILGTDEEIDQMVTRDLSSYVSHIYDMKFNPETGSSEQTKILADDISEFLTPMVEV